MIWLLRLVALAMFVLVVTMARQPLANYFFARGQQARQAWQLEAAISNFDWALRVQSDFVAVRFEKALALQLRGDFLTARRQLDWLAAVRTEDRHWQARLLQAIGVNQFHSNEADAAIETYQQSLALAKELNDVRLEAAARVGLGRALYHLKGQSDLALAYLQEALQQARASGDELIEADALRHTGVVYWWFKGELHRPLTDYYQPALDLYRRHNDLHSVAIMLCNIGLIHSQKGDLFQSLQYQNESLDLKQRIGDLAGLCDSYSFLGNLYSGLGNYRKAREYYVRSFDLSRRIGYPLAANEEEMLADIHLKLGDTDEAIAVLQRRSQPQTENPFQAKRYLGHLAYCYLLKGELETARNLFARVLEIEQQVGEPDVRSTLVTTTFLAETHVQLGELEQAEQLFQQAEALGATIPEEPRSLGHQVMLAEFYERQSKHTEAIGCLQEAADLLAQRFRASQTILVSGQHRQLYERIFTFLLDPTRRSAAAQGTNPMAVEDELAFRFLEQLRYSSFRDLILQLSEKQALPPAARQAEDEALARIRQLAERLHRRERAEWRQQLKQAYGEYEDRILKSQLADSRYRLLRQAQPLTLSATQQRLDATTALVEYLFAGERVYGLVVTHSAVRSFALPVSRVNLAAKVKLLRSLIFAKELSAQTNTTVAPIANEEENDWLPVAEDLRRALIEPLERSGAMRGIERLALIPFGPLQELPFAALVRRDAQGVRFLVEDYLLFRLPSASYVTQITKREEQPTIRATATMFSFGINETNEPELLPLRFAAVEAEAVAHLFNGEARINANASEAEFVQRAPQFTHLHLATHAVSEPHMPLLSRLKLSGTRDADGNLTVREVLDIQLQAELVTLGACQSAASFSASGDEGNEANRLGLIEAFLQAGARSVLASQLPISDRPTTEFMKAFYQHLRTQDKVTALANTQRALLRGDLVYPENGHLHRLTHPRYWASFILVGDPH